MSPLSCQIYAFCRHQGSVFWGMLNIIVVNIVVRGAWANDGLEGFLKGQGFVCDAAALLPRELFKLVTVDAGYFV